MDMHKSILNTHNFIDYRIIKLMHKLYNMEKDMATHSSILAWKIPRTEEPGGLPSMGSHRVGHDWSNLEAAAACILKTYI